jgi:long-chain acyl-CoA synthetase
VQKHLAMTLCYRSDVEPVSPDDEVVYAAPLSHGAGMYTFAYSASAACHVVPASGGFDAGELLDLARAVPGDRLCLFAAPTMVTRLVDEAQRRACGGDGIKSIIYGGGPMYLADLQRALDVLGPRLAQIYGQGESPMTITCLTRAEIADARLRGDHPRMASVGRSHSAVEVRVVDEHGQPCLAGQAGEVVVRGPTVMKGYWDQAEATAAALRQDWLYTGDIGAFDAYGFLTLLDRSKDVIISGGSNIYPREVEEVLLEHPAVREVSVIGVPDPQWGEKVVAFVVLAEMDRSGQASGLVLEAELLAQFDTQCLSRIARFKRPKQYVRLDCLPKNHNGKVLKTELRALFAT